MPLRIALKNFFVNNYVFCPLIYRNYTENFNLGGLAMTPFPHIAGLISHELRVVRFFADEGTVRDLEEV